MDMIRDAGSDRAGHDTRYRLGERWTGLGIWAQGELDMARDTALESAGHGTRHRAWESWISQEIRAGYDTRHGLGQNGIIMTFCGQYGTNNRTNEINTDLLVLVK